MSNTLYARGTRYGLVTVEQHGANERWLCVDGKCQGRVGPSGEPLSWYFLQCLRFVDTLAILPETCLVLGGGAFILPYQLSKIGIRVTTIEQNEELLDICRKYFFFPSESTVIVGDATKLIETIGEFDLVVLDLFNGFKGDIISPEKVEKYAVKSEGILLENRLTNGVSFRIKG